MYGDNPMDAVDQLLIFITLIDIFAWDVTSEKNKSVPVLVDQDLTTCIDAERHRTDILSTYTGWQTRGTHNFTIVSCTDIL